VPDQLSGSYNRKIASARSHIYLWSLLSDPTPYYRNDTQTPFAKYIFSRLGFKTCLSKTKIKTQQFQDQDFDVQDQDPRRRLKNYKTNTGSP